MVLEKTMHVIPMLLLLFVSPQIVAPETAKPQPVTEQIEPQFAKVVYQVQGRGDQIYVCAQQKDGMQWVLKGPAAVLYDASNQPVGKHGAGPQWTWNDGSAVRGTVIGRKASPGAGNVPWLLLKTDPFTGPKNGEHDPAGMLDKITFVKRSETRGGVAPTGGCDAANIGASQAVPYTATYTFYSPQP
jgi:hypothetical protein